jgi:hypothetical protein
VHSEERKRRENLKVAKEMRDSSLWEASTGKKRKN